MLFVAVAAASDDVAAASARTAKVARLAARQVDEVRLADRLEAGGVGALLDRPDEDWLDLRAQRPEMLDPQQRPAAEHLLEFVV